MNNDYARNPNGMVKNTNAFYHTAVQKAIIAYLKKKKKMVVNSHQSKKVIKVTSVITAEFMLPDSRMRSDVMFMSGDKMVNIEIINTNNISRKKKEYYHNSNSLLICIYIDELITACGGDEDILVTVVEKMLSQYNDDNVILFDYTELKKHEYSVLDKGAYLVVTKDSNTFALMKNKNVLLANCLKTQFDNVYAVSYDSKKTVGENIRAKKKI